MTERDVRLSEMPTPDHPDERAVEAFLTGPSVAAREEGPLSAFGGPDGDPGDPGRHGK